MNTIEERLRTATRAAADTVLPGSAPPLRLPEHAGLLHRGRVGALRRSPWVAPLAAAAGVAAVVGGTLVAVQAVGSGTAPRNQPAARHEPGLNPLLAHPATVDGLPPFFITPTAGPLMAAAGRHWVASVAIVSTATGRVVATPKLPGPVQQVAAGSDGRTFYAGVRRQVCPIGGHQPTPVPTPTLGPGSCGGGSQRTAEYFYKISLSGAGVAVSELPIAPVAGQVGSISPSPDGTELAITSYTVQGHMGMVRVLSVASTTTGETRQWTTSRPGGMAGPPVAWLADGHTVAFDWLSFTSSGNDTSRVRLLNTAVPGGSDLLAGPALMPLASPSGVFKTLTVSPDGSTAVGAEERAGGVVNGQTLPTDSVVSFAVRTGRPTAVLLNAAAGGRAYFGCVVLWVSRTGRRALVNCDVSPAGSSMSESEALLAQAGRAPRPLPQLSNLRLFPGMLGEP